MLPTKKLMAGLIPAGLVAGVVAVAMAVLPAVASATKVTPANTKITATNVGRTQFIAENAYSSTSVQCAKSTAEFMTPTEEAGTLYNTNRTEVGTHSTGSGSVNMHISPSPTFAECDVYAWNGTEWVNTADPAEVTTSGKWTMSATNNASGSTSGGTLAIAVPPNGATIAFATEAGTCTLTVSPEEADSVNSDYTNATLEDAVDGQIDFSSTAACGVALSPAQFEAVYKANAGFEIIN